MTTATQTLTDFLLSRIHLPRRTRLRRRVADVVSADTHDCTRLDYAFTPRDSGQRGRIACWSGKKPRGGDFLLLRNRGRSSRYKVLSVDLCMNVDPPTMWMAQLQFAPRVNADEARTAEVS